MSSKDIKYDDLTVIKGVGTVRQAWFRDVFNVETLSDFASLSVDEIESRLKEEGRIVSRNEVEQWLAQAQTLVAELPSPQAAPSSAVDRVGVGAGLVNEDEWEWLKAFVVEFCVLKSATNIKKREIRIYPLNVSSKGDWVENGSSKKTPIIFSQRDMFLAWITEQLHEQQWPVPTPETIPPVSSQVATATHQLDTASTEFLPAIKISQIRTFQPSHTNTPTGTGEAGQPFVGFVKGDAPFAVEVDFAISEKITEEVARKVGYKADFYVRSMNTNKTTSLGETMLDAFQPHETSYTARLPKATLPPGQYRLGVQVKLRSQPPRVTHLEVPMFQVFYT